MERTSPCFRTLRDHTNSPCFFVFHIKGKGIGAREVRCTVYKLQNSKYNRIVSGHNVKQSNVNNMQSPWGMVMGISDRSIL